MKKNLDGDVRRMVVLGCIPAPTQPQANGFRQGLQRAGNVAAGSVKSHD